MSEHPIQMELLAGYLDDELSPEDRKRVESHVPECSSCRAELRAQTVIRNRLMKESFASASSDLTGRVLARIGENSAAVAPAESRSPVRPLVTWGGWGIAAAMAGLALWFSQHPAGGGSMTMAMGPRTPVTLDKAPGEVTNSVIQSFRELKEEELPEGVDLARLRRELHFSVPALEAPHMRLISAWVTTVNGEPAAALAYRCHDRLVMQFVISEKLFFRQAPLRNAIASQGVYASAAGPLTTIAWPGADNGSFLVGEFSASDLVAMRT